MEESLDALKRDLDREKRARRAAEAQLEQQSLELYNAGRKLEEIHRVRSEKYLEQERLTEELRESETKLRENQGRLSAIVNSVIDAVIAIDSNGMIHTYNRAAERIFGYSVTETIGRNISMLLPEPHRSQHDGYIRRHLENPTLTVTGKTREVEGQRKDGSLVPLEVSIMETDFQDSRMFVGICRDISRRKEQEAERAQLETELRQAQKMESLGTLAGGIAHEINSPVQYVGDNVRFLQEAFDDLSTALKTLMALCEAAGGNDGLADAVQQAEAAITDADTDYLLEEIPNSIAQTIEGIDRIGEIVQAIKEFSHPGAKDKTAIDINHAITTTATVTRNQWKYVAEVVHDFERNLPAVPCLPGEFNQVILNLIVNAAHAIEEKGDEGLGHIVITTRRKESWIEIAVSDNGNGVDAEHVDKIFDPFFTTKEPGRGTGQGLSICHNIITKKHGGTISVESEPGQGTTFTVRLPLSGSDESREAA